MINESNIFIGNPVSLNYLKKDYKVIKQNQVNVKFTNNPIIIYEVFF